MQIFRLKGCTNHNRKQTLFVLLIVTAVTGFRIVPLVRMLVE